MNERTEICISWAPVYHQKLTYKQTFYELTESTPAKNEHIVTYLLSAWSPSRIVWVLVRGLASLNTDWSELWTMNAGEFALIANHLSELNWRHVIWRVTPEYDPETIQCIMHHLCGPRVVSVSGVRELRVVTEHHGSADLPGNIVSVHICGPLSLSTSVHSLCITQIGSPHF